MVPELDPVDSTPEAVAEQMEKGRRIAESRAAQAAKKASPPTSEQQETVADETAEAVVEEVQETQEEIEPVEAEEGAEVEEVQPQKFAVTVDGQTVEVPVDELISGYMRTQDYTRKTMAVSSDRTKLVQERRQFASEREMVAKRIGPLIQAAVESLEGEDLQALEELRQVDPGRWSERMLARQQKLEQVERLKQEQDQLARAARQEQVPLERQALVQKAPEFARDFANLYRGVGEYVLSQGFSPEEWNGVIDHRLVLMAYKSMRYDRLATRKVPEVKKQLGNLPRPARPGLPKPPRQVKQERAVAQRKAALESGTVEDVARYIENAHPIS